MFPPSRQNGTPLCDAAAFDRAGYVTFGREINMTWAGRAGRVLSSDQEETLAPGYFAKHW
jgi:hypothetical protein